MTKTLPEPGSSSAVVTTFREGRRTYERRYVDCGKDNCRRCTTPTGRVASHGPYWYLCFLRKGKWFRVYLGKVLDTSRYVTKAGDIDWDAIRKRKRTKAGDDGSSDVPPGQTDTISPAPPQDTDPGPVPPNV